MKGKSIISIMQLHLLLLLNGILFINFVALKRTEIKKGRGEFFTYTLWVLGY
jgi:hypothetical protein